MAALCVKSKSRYTYSFMAPRNFRTLWIFFFCYKDLALEISVPKGCEAINKTSIKIWNLPGNPFRNSPNILLTSHFFHAKSYQTKVGCLSSGVFESNLAKFFGGGRKKYFCRSQAANNNNNGHVSWKLPSQNICKKSEGLISSKPENIGKMPTSLIQWIFFWPKKERENGKCSTEYDPFGHHAFPLLKFHFNWGISWLVMEPLLWNNNDDQRRCCVPPKEKRPEPMASPYSQNQRHSLCTKTQRAKHLFFRQFDHLR